MVGGLKKIYGLNNAYKQYGNNQKGLFVLATFCNCNDEVARTWDETQGVLYPSINRDGFNDTDVRWLYADGQMFGTPAVCLIAPDRKIVEKDLADETACISNPNVDSLMIILRQYPIGQSVIKTNLTPKKTFKVLKNITPQHINLNVPSD